MPVHPLTREHDDRNVFRFLLALKFDEEIITGNLRLVLIGDDEIGAFHPGQQDAYELFLRSVKAAEDKAGVRRIRSSTVQGIASRHIALTLTESHAQRAALPGPPQLLRDEYGAERAHAILEGAQRAVRSRRFQVLELRPELSRTGN